MAGPMAPMPVAVASLQAGPTCKPYKHEAGIRRWARPPFLRSGSTADPVMSWRVKKHPGGSHCVCFGLETRPNGSENKGEMMMICWNYGDTGWFSDKAKSTQTCSAGGAWFLRSSLMQPLLCGRRTDEVAFKKWREWFTTRSNPFEPCNGANMGFLKCGNPKTMGLKILK